MRTKVLTVSGKEITLQEKKIGELKKIIGSLSGSLDKITKADDFNSISKVLTGVLANKIPEIVPELKKEDIDEAYPSEIEDLIKGFIDINFTGIKTAGSYFMKLIQLQYTVSGTNSDIANPILKN